MTPLKVYIAGASIDRGVVSIYMTRLREGGCLVTLDWPAVQAGVSIPDHELSEEERRKYSGLDLDGVRQADLLWLMLPSQKGRSVGAWIEFGFALGLGKLVVVSGNLSDSIFTAQAHAGYWSHDNALEAILEKNKLRQGGVVEYGNGTLVQHEARPVTRAEQNDTDETDFPTGGV